MKKTNHIADFGVKDHPKLKRAQNPLTEEDLALVKSIYVSNIIKCMDKYPMPDAWLDEENGLANFASFFAMQRAQIRDVHGLSFSDRGQSHEQLKWLHTKGPKAGFYPENISYSVSIQTINTRTKLFDLKEQKGDTSETFPLVSAKKGPKSIKKVKRQVSFSYEFWLEKHKLVIPTIHNIPSGIAVIISEKSGRRVSLTSAIKEGGGSPYHGLTWLRKNKEGTIEEAVIQSLIALAKDMKEEGLEYEKIVAKMMKSFSKIPERIIRAIVGDKFIEKGEDFSVKEVNTLLKRMNASLKSCTVWDENLDYVEFESTELAAEALGYAVATVRCAISTGKKTGNGYWITRGEVPLKLQQKQKHKIRMKANAQIMHQFLKNILSPTDEAIYHEVLRTPDLSLVARSFNLREDQVAFRFEKALDIIDTELKRANKNEQATSLNMEPISAIGDERSKIIKERVRSGEDTENFDIYANRGIPALSYDTTGKSNINSSGESVDSEKDVKKK